MALSVALALGDSVMHTPADWQVTARLHNDGDEPVRVPVALLAGPVVFELATADGRTVAPGPPPVPPRDAGESLRTIDAGAALALTYAGHELVHEAPEPGRYRLRFHTTLPDLGADTWSGELASDWVALEVAPGA